MSSSRLFYNRLSFKITSLPAYESPDVVCQSFKQSVTLVFALVFDYDINICYEIPKTV